jgi:hypothetical protein
MALPPFIRKSIENKLQAYCEEGVPDHIRDKLRYGFKIRGNSVTLFEERSSFPDRSRWVEIVVAQFRFNQENGKWTLYWADRNSRWHIYYDLNPNKNFDVLLQEVEKDPTCIFWG